MVIKVNHSCQVLTLLKLERVTTKAATTSTEIAILTGVEAFVILVFFAALHVGGDYREVRIVRTRKTRQDPRSWIIVSRGVYYFVYNLYVRETGPGPSRYTTKGLKTRLAPRSSSAL